MGTIPSRESHESPSFFYFARSGCNAIAALPLTRHFFPDPNCLAFQQLFDCRSRQSAKYNFSVLSSLHLMRHQAASIVPPRFASLTQEQQKASRDQANTEGHPEALEATNDVASRERRAPRPYLLKRNLEEASPFYDSAPVAGGGPPCGSGCCFKGGESPDAISTSNDSATAGWIGVDAITKENYSQFFQDMTDYIRCEEDKEPDVRVPFRPPPPQEDNGGGDDSEGNEFTEENPWLRDYYFRDPESLYNILVVTNETNGGLVDTNREMCAIYEEELRWCEARAIVRAYRRQCKEHVIQRSDGEGLGTGGDTSEPTPPLKGASVPSPLSHSSSISASSPAPFDRRCDGPSSEGASAVPPVTPEAAAAAAQVKPPRLFLRPGHEVIIRRMSAGEEAKARAAYYAARGCCSPQVPSETTNEVGAQEGEDVQSSKHSPHSVVEGDEGDRPVDPAAAAAAITVHDPRFDINITPDGVHVAGVKGSYRFEADEVYRDGRLHLVAEDGVLYVFAYNPAYFRRLSGPKSEGDVAAAPPPSVEQGADDCTCNGGVAGQQRVVDAGSSWTPVSAARWKKSSGSESTAQSALTADDESEPVGSNDTCADGSEADDTDEVATPTSQLQVSAQSMFILPICPVRVAGCVAFLEAKCRGTPWLRQVEDDPEEDAYIESLPSRPPVMHLTSFIDASVGNRILSRVWMINLQTSHSCCLAAGLPGILTRPIWCHNLLSNIPILQLCREMRFRFRAAAAEVERRYEGLHRHITGTEHDFRSYIVNPSIFQLMIERVKSAQAYHTSFPSDHRDNGSIVIEAPWTSIGNSDEHGAVATVSSAQDVSSDRPSLTHRGDKRLELPCRRDNLALASAARPGSTASHADASSYDADPLGTSVARDQALYHASGTLTPPSFPQKLLFPRHDSEYLVMSTIRGNRMLIRIRADAQSYFAMLSRATPPLSASHFMKPLDTSRYDYGGTVGLHLLCNSRTGAEEAQVLGPPRNMDQVRSYYHAYQRFKNESSVGAAKGGGARSDSCPEGSAKDPNGRAAATPERPEPKRRSTSIAKADSEDSQCGPRAPPFLVFVVTEPSGTAAGPSKEHYLKMRSSPMWTPVPPHGDTEGAHREHQYMYAPGVFVDGDLVMYNVRWGRWEHFEPFFHWELRQRRVQATAALQQGEGPPADAAEPKKENPEKTPPPPSADDAPGAGEGGEVAAACDPSSALCLSNPDTSMAVVGHVEDVCLEDILLCWIKTKLFNAVQNRRDDPGWLRDKNNDFVMEGNYLFWGFQQDGQEFFYGLIPKFASIKRKRTQQHRTQLQKQQTPAKKGDSLCNLSSTGMEKTMLPLDNHMMMTATSLFPETTISTGEVVGLPTPETDIPEKSSLASAMGTSTGAAKTTDGVASHVSAGGGYNSAYHQPHHHSSRFGPSGGRGRGAAANRSITGSSGAFPGCRLHPGFTSGNAALHGSPTSRSAFSAPGGDPPQYTPPSPPPPPPPHLPTAGAGPSSPPCATSAGSAKLALPTSFLQQQRPPPPPLSMVLSGCADTSPTHNPNSNQKKKQQQQPKATETPRRNPSQANSFIVPKPRHWVATVVGGIEVTQSKQQNTSNVLGAASDSSLAQPVQHQPIARPQPASDTTAAHIDAVPPSYPLPSFSFGADHPKGGMAPTPSEHQQPYQQHSPAAAPLRSERNYYAGDNRLRASAGGSTHALTMPVGIPFPGERGDAVGAAGDVWGVEAYRPHTIPFSSAPHWCTHAHPEAFQSSHLGTGGEAYFPRAQSSPYCASSPYPSHQQQQQPPTAPLPGNLRSMYDTLPTAVHPAPPAAVQNTSSHSYHTASSFLGHKHAANRPTHHHSQSHAAAAPPSTRHLTNQSGASAPEHFALSHSWQHYPPGASAAFTPAVSHEGPLAADVPWPPPNVPVATAAAGDNAPRQGASAAATTSYTTVGNALNLAAPAYPVNPLQSSSRYAGAQQAPGRLGEGPPQGAAAPSSMPDPLATPSALFYPYKRSPYPTHPYKSMPTPHPAARHRSSGCDNTNACALPHQPAADLTAPSLRQPHSAFVPGVPPPGNSMVGAASHKQVAHSQQHSGSLENHGSDGGAVVFKQAQYPAPYSARASVDASSSAAAHAQGGVHDAKEATAAVLTTATSPGHTVRVVIGPNRQNVYAMPTVAPSTQQQRVGFYPQNSRSSGGASLAHAVPPCSTAAPTMPATWWYSNATLNLDDPAQQQSPLLSPSQHANSPTASMNYYNKRRSKGPVMSLQTHTQEQQQGSLFPHAYQSTNIPHTATDHYAGMTGG